MLAVMMLSKHPVLSPARLVKKFHVNGTIEHLGFSLSRRVFDDPLKNHETYGQDPEIHSKPRRVSLLVS